MRLRSKVLLTTVAVMALGYVMVTLASVGQIMESARSENAALAGRLFKWAAKRGSSVDAPERAADVLAESELLDEWAILAPDGTVMAASNPALMKIASERPPGRQIETAPGPSGAGKFHYRLYGTAALSGTGLGGYVLALLPSMLVGTVLLAVVLLALLSRQVLNPVTELAKASRLLASGGEPAPQRGELRADEIGQLVRSFNQMAGEVTGHRKELEKRVAEATDKFLRAQQAAAIAQRLAATGKLAAGVAHEINNPLGGMVNAARRLESVVPDGGRDREYLDLINEGLERVGRIVKQMTRFGRSAPEPKPEAVDAVEAIESALRFAEHRLKGAELVREIPDGLPTVLGDRQGLEQVFLNLILNAADAVADAETRRVTVKASAGEGNRLLVEVADTGCGMTAEECNAAFDIFHTTKGAGEGSGLGLPVAHSIVESHGGELRLESTRGAGTRAVVSLPVGEGEEAPQ